MFYKDKAGIQVCQLGKGDVSVSTIEWKAASASGVKDKEVGKE